MWLLQVLSGHRRGRLRQGCWEVADWAEEGLMAWCPLTAWVSQLRSHTRASLQRPPGRPIWWHWGGWENMGYHAACKTPSSDPTRVACGGFKASRGPAVVPGLLLVKWGDSS